MVERDAFGALRDELNTEEHEIFDRDPVPTVDVVEHMHTDLYKDGPAAQGLVWLAPYGSCSCDICEEFGKKKTKRKRENEEAVGAPSLQEIASKFVDQHMDFPTPLSAAVWAATRDISWMEQALVEEKWKAVGVVGRHPSRLGVQIQGEDTVRIDCVNNAEFWLVVDVRRLRVLEGRVPDFTPRVCPNKYMSMILFLWDSPEVEQRKRTWHDTVDEANRRQVATYRRGLAGYAVQRNEENNVLRITFETQPDFFVELSEISRV